MITRIFEIAADGVGLTESERVILQGAPGPVKRQIAAIKLLSLLRTVFVYPAKARSWLRAPCGEEGFRERSPLQRIVEEGEEGLLLVDFYLRSRTRLG